MNQDNIAAQKPIDVQCKCGWVGKSDQLERRAINSNEMVCPKCYAIFKAWPARN